MSVGGTIGGQRGGQARKEQMAREAGGSGAGDEAAVHEAYSQMGKSGAEKGGFSTGYAHDPEQQRAHGVDPDAPEQVGAVKSADRGAGGGGGDTGGREPDVV